MLTTYGGICDGDGIVDPSGENDRRLLHCASQLKSECYGCLYFALQAGAHKDESNIPEMQNTTMI